MKKLPDGFEFIEAKKKMNIRKEKDNKEQYMDLLLEADPQKEIVEKYLEDGDLFVLTDNGETICVAVVTFIDEDIVELKNLATKEENRG